MTNRQRRCKAVIDGVKCREKFTASFQQEHWCCDDHRDIIIKDTLAKDRKKKEQAINKAKKDADKAYNKKTREMRERIKPVKRKTGGVKRDPIDIVFSYLVRERANWICECCGVDYSQDKQNLHCSHYQKRSKKGTRYHPDNCLAHCVSCHMKLESAPGDMDKEYIRCHSLEKKDHIVLLSNQYCKLLDHQIKEIFDHYKTEEKRLKQIRSEGHDGYLAFTCPDFYYKGD